MHPLPNPRHETFALHLAEGFTLAYAYEAAGFPAKNAKTRATHLARNPAIAERIGYLKACLTLQTSPGAQSSLSIPETRDQLSIWLWQVASGIRQINTRQLRAATLLARLKGWHLHPAARKPRPFHIPGQPWPDSPPPPAPEVSGSMEQPPPPPDPQIPKTSPPQTIDPQPLTPEDSQNTTNFTPPPPPSPEPPPPPPTPKPLRCVLKPPFNAESHCLPPGVPRKRWTSR